MDSCARELSRRTEQRGPNYFSPTFLHFRFFSPLSRLKRIVFFSPSFLAPCWGYCLREELKRLNKGRYPRPARTHCHPATPTICHSRGRVSCSPNYRLRLRLTPGIPWPGIPSSPSDAFPTCSFPLTFDCTLDPF